MIERLRSILLPGLTFVLFVLLWELAVAVLRIPPFLLPAPSALAAAAQGFGPALITVHLAATLQTVLLGFLVSALLGVPLGTALATNRFAAEAFYPLLVFTHAIPVIAVAPIIVVVFGIGLPSRLIVVTLIGFFPIMVSTATGILGTPTEMKELAATAGATKLQTIRTIQLPYAVPSIFGGLKIGIVGAVVGAVVAEFVSADSGLGYLVIRSTTDFNIPLALAAVVALAMLSVVLYQTVIMVERLLLPPRRR